MKWFRENITENPAMAEVIRLNQILRGRGGAANGLRSALIVAILISGLFTLLIGTTRGALEPYVVLVGQFIFCCLSIPLLFYGAIAGEREKRSWDLLRVAPITNLQLVFGKFASMAAFAVAVHVIFLVPLLYSMFSPADWRGLGYGGSGVHWENPLRVFVGETYSLLLCLFVAALTLFFSARSKRSYTALAMTLGTLAILYIIMPMFMSGIGNDVSLPYFLNPFLGLTQFGSMFWYEYRSDGGTRDVQDVAVYGAIFCVACFAPLLVIYANYTLAFADNLVKFVKQK